ncbi:probable N-acetyltransferase 16 isoform X3 [Branchiostoma floridae]|uniref:Probable N-acetyltransferase 16 isoform X3 n=1 Tax=Branchiostoma floridae TaxID=7739 RepID=A0A9J7K7E2_BRAFL|nr:probable N-acetyltransferase 16 isoform X3 [Branchiostoma floridae]
MCTASYCKRYSLFVRLSGSILTSAWRLPTRPLDPCWFQTRPKITRPKFKFTKVLKMADNTTSGADLALTFRMACHGDYDSVMRMSEGIYEGKDYLPAFFHSFIDDPDVIVFLALVGLRASKITESGTAFIVKAARIAPDWRGQGIDRRLSLHQDQWMRQNRPTVKYKRSTAFSLSQGVTESMKKKMRYIFSMPFIEYQSEPNLWWRQDPAQLAQLDTTGLPDVVPLQDADDDFCTAVQKWLPAGACGTHDGKPVILVDWDPFTLSPANLKYLQAQNKIYVLKHEGEVSLSISNTYLSPSARMLCVQIYAKDLATVLKHLLTHLKDASRTYHGDAICTSVFVSQFELEDAMHDFCRQTLQMDPVQPSKTQALAFEAVM